MNILDNNLQNISLNTDGSHFFHLYKNESKIEDYRNRMKEDIKNRRIQKRHMNFDINRALDSSTNEDDNLINNCFYKPGLKNKSRWSNLMMLAEWFLLVPDGFHEEYFMKFCPIGRHVLVVSSKNKTSLFNKRGRMLSSFESGLPGGARECQTSSKSAVLDCIFDESHGVIYVLDVIYYLKQDFQLMTAECRFSWLEEYLSAEISSDLTCSTNFRFVTVPAVKCDRHSLEVALSKSPSHSVDGLLFYWADGTYTSGSTYCATWLKPYMVPELLSIDVHPDFMSNIPMDYDNYRADIINYNKKYSFKFDIEKISNKPKRIEENME